MKKIYGYDYNEKTNEYEINQKEANRVGAIFDMTVTYRLANNEVAFLLNGKGTIFDVIKNRIMDLLSFIEFHELDIETSFIEEKDIDYQNDQEVTNTLIKLKNLSENVDSDSKKIINEKIDSILFIVSKSDEITKKLQKL